MTEFVEFIRVFISHFIMSLTSAPEITGRVDAVAPHYDYYSKIPIETAEYSFVNETIHPINGISDDVIEFVVEPYDKMFICMDSISFNVTFQLVRKNDEGAYENVTHVSLNPEAATAAAGAAAAATAAAQAAAGAAVVQQQPTAPRDNVAPCNDPLASMWKSIQVRLNGVNISGDTGEWPGFKSYIEHILSCKNLFYGPIEGRLLCHDDLKNDFTNNTGHAFRMSHIRGGKVSISGRLPIDFFNANNFLAPNNRLEISLTKQLSAFFIKSPTAGKQYKINLEGINMNVRRLLLHPHAPRIVSPRDKQFYVCPHAKITPILVRQHTQNFVAPISRGGIIPKQIVMGFVEAASFHGRPNKQPFNFKTAGVQRVNLRVNNISMPNEALEVDWDNNNISRYLCHLYRNIGKRQRGSLYLSPSDDYANGYALYAFDLRPDKCNGQHIHAGRSANLEAEFQFKKGLDKNYMLVIYSLYDQVLAIDPENGIPHLEYF